MTKTGTDVLKQLLHIFHVLLQGLSFSFSISAMALWCFFSSHPKSFSCIKSSAYSSQNVLLFPVSASGQFWVSAKTLASFFRANILDFLTQDSNCRDMLQGHCHPKKQGFFDTGQTVVWLGYLHLSGDDNLYNRVLPSTSFCFPASLCVFLTLFINTTLDFKLPRSTAVGGIVMKGQVYWRTHSRV